MCGIAGIINLNNESVEKEALLSMLKTIKHRGPDGEGILIDKNIGLGHVRLSIIDLSELAHQPMSYGDENYWIIHNGEVYNYIELREELEKKGYKFRSASDTEVILASYLMWGESCVNKFNGMWAFVIYDVKNRKIFASRDRFGIKPFYYHKNNSSFVFASEIKALLINNPGLKNPHYSYLHYFFNTGALDDADDTFYKDIKALPPAHSLTIEGNQLKIYRYWDYYESSRESYDYTKPEETFLELLTKAVNLRLRSDVPVGTCLSGGLDSSSIVTLSSKMIEARMHTFSSIYEDKDCDESYYINIVNNFNNTISHQVFPESKNFMDILKKIVYHQDEPSAGPGLYSQWHVMQLAQDNVKVLLDGQGADELLGGYFYFFEHYLSSVKKENNTGSLDLARRILNEYPKIKELTNMEFCGGKVEMLREVLLPRFLNNLLRMPKINLFKKEGSSVFHPEFVFAAVKDRLVRTNGRKFKNDLDNASYAALTRTSIPALLHYEDRNSMAFSIESRVPFLDYRLVEFCMGLPFEEKIKEDTTKVVMRKALKDVLPREVVERRDKKGYPTPFARWLRSDIKNDVADILLSEKSKNRNIFNHKEVEKQFRKHVTGEADLSWQIWRYLTTEVWFREFID
ncbi:MAG: asparagine synthase (glutamine-hydrolyzing) [Armatimonadota bacterium]